MPKTYAILVILVVLVMVAANPAFAEGGTAPPVPLIDLTPIFQALIGLLATLITVKVMPWIRAKVSAQQQELLTSTVRILVYAAEQMYSTVDGEAKLDYVMTELALRGYKMDRAAIESAVREMHIWGSGATLTPAIFAESTTE